MTDFAATNDRRDWRPLDPRPTSRPPAIKDPILEPLWQGLRVLAHYRTAADASRGTVELRDQDGDDVSADYPDIVDALKRAITAQEAVIDGVLTDQAMAGGEGVGVVPEAELSPVGMLLGRPAEVTIAASRDRAAAGAMAFVALDLLSIDDEPLLDLPLLERKRQLDSVLLVNELARVSPFARPPIAQWLNSWRSAGFRGITMKAANSRYHPADVTREWAIVERISRR